MRVAEAGDVARARLVGLVVLVILVPRRPVDGREVEHERRSGDRAQLDMVLAIPLERAGLQTRTGNPRLLVSLTTRLWPWSF